MVFSIRSRECWTCILLLAVVAISGCTTFTQFPEVPKEEIQNEHAVQTALVEANLQQATQRVANAVWPILSNNVNLCGDFVHRQSGVWIARKQLSNWRYLKRDPSDKSAKKSLVGEEPVIWGVAVGSPAEAAGLQVGDLILSVNQKDITSSEQARRQLDKLLLNKSSGRIDLEIRRGSNTEDFSLTPIEVCRSKVFVSSNKSINAYADGKTIHVLTGLLEFVESEEQLQFVLAHELAHNVAGHVPKAMARAIVGGFFDLAAAAVYRVWTGGLIGQFAVRAFSKPHEREADYMAVYFLENAGVNTNGIEDFWRKLGSQHVPSLSFHLTHPSTPERYIFLRKTKEEIAAKRASGKPLLPELK